jgi:RNA polymerase sigma-70 factor (ECF subfamily)
MELNDYNICVHQWADPLFRFAYKCTGRQEDAEDVVQSSFEVLWQKRNDVQPQKAKAFLFQVAYNRSVDEYRRQGRVSYKEVVMDDAATMAPANPDLKRMLDRALQQLDERSRALVLLKDLEGYKYEEIAQITELSVEQVKVYLHRARKVLKEYLVSVENII